MAAKRGQRDNVLAGALVLGCLITAVVVIIILSGAVDALARKTYAVRFPISIGVPDLVQGSAVQIAGVTVGGVENINLPKGMQAAAAGEDGDGPYVTVTFGIDRSYTLYENARIELVQELLGGSSTLNITDLGDPQAGPLRIGEPPIGERGGGLLSRLGVGEQVEAMPELIAQWIEVGRRANEVIASLQEPLPTWIKDLGSFITFLNKDLPAQISAAFDRLKTAEAFFSDARQIVAENRQELSQGVERFNQLMAASNQLLEENRGDVRHTVENIAQASEKLKSFLAELKPEDLQRLRNAAAAAEKALTNANELVSDARLVLAENRPNLRRAIAKLRLTADQALDTMIEVRRAPWRLLYRPDERETAYELLYDAARQYARSVEELSGLSASLESLAQTARQGGPAPSEEVLSDLEAAVERSRMQYEQAEKLFLDALLQVSDRTE